MKNKVTPWLSAGAVFLVFAALGIKLPGWLRFTGTTKTIFTWSLVGLGIVAFVLVLLMLLARAKKKKPAQVDGGAEIDQAIASAEATLAASNMAPVSRLGRLPLALVLGPTGSTKSSVLTHSGLDPELLAGEVMRGDTVTPTDPVNIWYAHGTVIVEAGGRLLDDAGRFGHLIRQLQPRRLAAAMGRGRQAPRVAIVCFACDEFLKPGASANVQTLGRQIRARLAEASQQLGIRLPVYFMFTRADRLPYFTDYVRSLSADEAQQVLGATLPLAAEAGGPWAERESRRLNEAFSRIIHALSVRRLEVLPRETQEEVRAGAYEFPRELRKIAEPAVQLLLDVFRPSQLGVNPFLRGFYFTGVRPIILRDSAAEMPTPAARATNPGADAGATSVFNAALLRQAMQQPTAPGGGRKVPQWVFLHRFFRDVLLRDDVALNLTGGGTRVDLLRRGLIASAAAASVLLSVGFTWSFASNRKIIRDSRAAMQYASDVGTVPGRGPAEDLPKLDSLRRQTVRVGTIDRGQRKWTRSLGLYTGDRVHTHVRSFYFRRFDGALWRSTRQAIIDYMTQLPPTPGPQSDFSRTQDALAAHLLTTSRNDLSTPELLTGPLLQNWRAPNAGDEERELAKSQFDFFATELPLGNPFPQDAPIESLVETTREFLLAFGSDAYYSALLSSANQLPPIRCTACGEYVRNDRVVEGAFTMRAQREVVDKELGNVEAMFARYKWLYGDRAPVDKPSRDELARRYYADYVTAWKRYLRGAEVVRLPLEPPVAARHLKVLSEPQSPLFRLLAQVSFNTSMPEGHPIAKSFQPVHAVVAPDVDERGNLTAKVPEYAAALSLLASNVELLRPGQSSDQATIAANAVKQQVSTIANTFAPDAEAMDAAADMRRLLSLPADQAQVVAGSQGAEELKRAAQQFCDNYRSIQSLFPFNRQAQQDANIADVTKIFQKEGLLWSLYQDHLQPRITPAGDQKAGADLRVTSGFLGFFKRAVEFSNALYKDAGITSFDIGFRPEIPAGATQVILQIDGASETFTLDRRANRTFSWDPSRASEASLIVVFGSERVTVAAAQGTWAIFRLFHAGTWSGNERVDWAIRDRSPLTASVSITPGVRPLLQRGNMDVLNRCVLPVN